MVKPSTERRRNRIARLYFDRRKERKQIALIIGVSYRRVCEVVQSLDGNSAHLVVARISKNA